MLLDFGTQEPRTPILVNGSVWLRPIGAADYSAWTLLREKSKSHLTAWEPAWRSQDMSPQAFRRRVKAYIRDMRRGASVSLLVFKHDSDTLIGGVTLSGIRLGAARSATLGYWIGAPFVRRGYGRAAISAVLEHVFTTMNLNRVEAACQPENAASIRLLEATGFTREGLARDYLRINGAWRDHLLFAVTAKDYAGMKHSEGAL